jgi:hypothetical protein
MSPNRQAVVPVVLAALAVLGMGLAAATLDSTYTSDIGTGSGPSDSDEGDEGVGTPSDGAKEPDQESATPEQRESQSPVTIPSVCLTILTQDWVTAIIALGFVGLLWVTYRQFALLGAAFTVYIVGLPLTLGYTFLTRCASASGTSQSPVGQLLKRAGEVAPTAQTPIPPYVLAAVFGIATVAAAVLLVSSTGSQEIEPPSHDDEGEEASLSDIAQAAGAAADRIETTDASVDNAVYRAWNEMTAMLDIATPDSSTAGEFADAAVDAGMRRDDVSGLTQVFEEVRYGGMDPEPREEHALETLRRIEETYGAGSDAGPADAADHAASDDRDDTPPGGGDVA